jgi:hypothetical protein
MINDVTKFMSYQHGNIVWAPDPNDLGRSPRFDCILPITTEQSRVPKKTYSHLCTHSKSPPLRIKRLSEFGEPQWGTC